MTLLTLLLDQVLWLRVHAVKMLLLLSLRMLVIEDVIVWAGAGTHCMFLCFEANFRELLQH